MYTKIKQGVLLRRENVKALVSDLNSACKNTIAFPSVLSTDVIFKAMLGLTHKKVESNLFSQRNTIIFHSPLCICKCVSLRRLFSPVN